MVYIKFFHYYELESMYTEKHVFSQLIEFLLLKSFQQIVMNYQGDK